MNDSKEITTFDDVINILEGEINNFQVHLQNTKVNSKNPEYAYMVGQTNGLLLAQTLLLQLQRNQTKS